jgi:DNA-binding transcriptional MocR family regulator
MGRMPLYRDIAEGVLEQVATGALAPGATLPSVRTTAAERGTTPATVGRAYAELARLGVIDGAPRRAARVTRDGATNARRALHGGTRLRLAGSDDPLLDRIAGDAERIGARGSLGGLAALWQRRADAATLHQRHRDGR